MPGIIGYPSIAGTEYFTGSGDFVQALVGAQLYTAVGGDVVTALWWYGTGPGVIELGLYDTTGSPARPNNRIVTRQITLASGTGWNRQAVRWVLTPDVVYSLGADIWISGTPSLFFTDTPGIDNQYTGTAVTSLPNPWPSDVFSQSVISFYAEVTTETNQANPTRFVQFAPTEFGGTPQTLPVTFPRHRYAGPNPSILANPPQNATTWNAARNTPPRGLFGFSPRNFMPRTGTWPYGDYPAGVGGSTFTANLAGSITASATKVRAITKPLAGTITGSGNKTRLTAKALAGSSTASGALTLIRAALLSLTGSITGSGALAKQANKALAGSSTASGALAKQDAKALAGTTTGSGAIAKLVSKALAGSSTASGALTTTRVLLRALAGSITGSGALAKQANKALAGTSTASGAIAKQDAKALAGTTTGTGAISKLASKALAGSSTGSGVLTTTRVLLRALAGSITGSGALAKQANKALAGSSTGSGAVAKRPAKALAGSSTGSGAVAKAAAKAYVGTITATGAVAKVARKAFAGMVTLAGVVTSVVTGGGITQPGPQDATFRTRYRADNRRRYVIDNRGTYRADNRRRYREQN